MQTNAKVQNIASLDAENQGDQFFEQMEDDDIDNPTDGGRDGADGADGVPDHLSNTDGNDPSPAASPYRNNLSPLSRGDNALHSSKIFRTLQNLRKITAENSRKIEQVRKGAITKEVLDEAFNRYADRISNSNKENEFGAEEPEFTADHKV